MKTGHHYLIHTLLGVALVAALAALCSGPGYAQQAQTSETPSATAPSHPPETETVVVTSSEEQHRTKPFDMEECYLDGSHICRRVTCVEWATPTGWQRSCADHRDNHFP